MQDKLKTAAVLGAALVAALSGTLISGGPAAAITPTSTTIDFAGDTTGPKPAGFVSAATPTVRFQATGGGTIQVVNAPPATDGNGIASFGAAAGLDIRFASPATSVVLAFGNDDNDTTHRARLEVFRGVTQVGTEFVSFNANGTLDQTIRYANARVFDRAVLTYVDAAGVAINRTEAVDDIVVPPLCTKAGNGGSNVIVGTSKKDVLCGDSGNDVIKSGGRNDIVYAGTGNDAVLTGDGSDWVNGGLGRDEVRGGDGADILRGFDGRDRLFGERGADVLDGGISRDRCDGGPGRDTAVACERRIAIR
jgi:Ca2+-binding RTX toxin-like protein